MVINLCFSVLQWCWGPFASWARPRPFLAIHPCCLKKPSMPSHMQMCSLDFTDPKKPPGLNNNHPKLVNRAAVQHSLPRNHNFLGKYMKWWTTVMCLLYTDSWGWCTDGAQTFEVTFTTNVQKKKKKKAFIVLYLNDMNYYCLRPF